MYYIENTIDTKNSLITSDVKESNIVFDAGTEMLKVAKDGFYVRGVKVPIDDNEAITVYNAFHQWLTWATLNRNY